MMLLLADEEVTFDTGWIITILVIIVLLLAAWWLWTHRRGR
jgi:hypothetical protein